MFCSRAAGAWSARSASSCSCPSLDWYGPEHPLSFVLGALVAGRAGRLRVLELRLANRGNVTESLARGQVRLALRRGALDVGLRAGDRTIRPRTDGVVQIPCPRFRRGWFTATVQIASEPGRPAAPRTFRIQL